MDLKIKKGDTVEVISGKLEDKGKRGEVIKVIPSDETCGGIRALTCAPKHQRQVQSQGRTVNTRQGEV